MGEDFMFGRTSQIVSSALASRAFTLSGRRRCAPATKMLLGSRFVEQQFSSKPTTPKNVKARTRRALSFLVGPAGWSSIAIASGD